MKQSQQSLEEKMKTLSLELPDKVATRLGALAKRQNKTSADLAKALIEDFLGKHNGHHQKTTCGQLAGNLIGSLEGPGDLSYNKNHMEGFGL
jgi:hypothetical protein